MTTPQPPRIDWFRVIVDLERAGVSLDRIALTIGRKKGWITNLKYTPGTDPKFHDGLMLIGLWKTSTAWAEGTPIPYEPTERPANSPETALAGLDTPRQPKEPLHGKTRPESPDARRAARGRAADVLGRPVAVAG